MGPFIKLRNYWDNFTTKSACSLLDPTESSVGKMRKQVLGKVCWEQGGSLYLSYKLNKSRDKQNYSLTQLNIGDVFPFIDEHD